MALDLQISVQNNTSTVIFSDDTGDYNAVTNLTGWGTPNADETDLSDVAMVITPPGETEDTFDPLGTYDNAVAYVVDDVVYYSGSWYKCILASTGNLPSNDTYWEAFSVTDLGTFLASATDRDVTSDIEGEDLSLVDGIWKYNILLAWDGTQPVGTQTSEAVYALRINDLDAAIARLALRNLDNVDFTTIKSKRDTAVLAFDSAEYVLAEDIIEELTDLLEDEDMFVDFVRCNCLP